MPSLLHHLNFTLLGVITFPCFFLFVWYKLSSDIQVIKTSLNPIQKLLVRGGFVLLKPHIYLIIKMEQTTLF